MVDAIVQAITGSFESLGTAILEFIRDGFKTVFVNTTGGITEIGIFVFCMLGISLTIGLTRWIMSLVRRKI